MDEHEQTETAPRPSFWKRNRKAFLWASVALAVLGTISAIIVPNLLTRNYDAVAWQAGRSAKLIKEEIWSSDRGSSYNSWNNLADLLKFNPLGYLSKDLTDDPEVTFSFGTCNASGYTFTTTHKRGSKTFVFTD